MNPITLFLVIACALVGLALSKTVDMFLAPPFLVAAVVSTSEGGQIGAAR
jgi:hypothetical protein